MRNIVTVRREDEFTLQLNIIEDRHCLTLCAELWRRYDENTDQRSNIVSRLAELAVLMS